MALGWIDAALRFIGSVALIVTGIGGFLIMFNVWQLTPQTIQFWIGFLLLQWALKESKRV